MLLLPFVLTSLNIIVNRFAHDGMPVKSMLMPPVVATAVASVSGCESLDGVTAPLAMFAAVKTPVVSVVVSLKVTPEDVIEVGMGLQIS
jgi:hypothetical protein